MKKAIFSLFILFNIFGSVVNAWECQSALLGDELDSNSFFLSEEKFNKSMDEGGPDFAAQAVESVRRQVGCEAAPVELAAIKCRDVIDEDASSKVCVVSAPEGMFFIISDFMGNARVVYNRWD